MTEKHNTDKQAKSANKANKKGADKALQEAQSELKSYMEELAKERASFINYRNRAVKDQETARFFGKKDILQSILPVLDDINRAREQGELNPDTPFGAIAAKLESSLEKQGISAFGEVGEKFNHELHEAIMSHEDENADEETVNAIIEKGYKIGDELIRPARVGVAVPFKSESGESEG